MESEGKNLINLLMMIVKLEVINDNIGELNLAGIDRHMDWVYYVRRYDRTYKVDYSKIEKIEPKYKFIYDDELEKDISEMLKHHLQSRLQNQSQVPSQQIYKYQTPSSSELDSS